MATKKQIKKMLVVNPGSPREKVANQRYDNASNVEAHEKQEEAHEKQELERRKRFAKRDR